MDVENWLNSSRTGGYHRRQVSALTISGPWNKSAPKTWWNVNWWSIFAHVATFWAPASLLQCCGYRDPQVRQAFREKFALCFIILLMCVALGLFTFGLGPLLCPSGVYLSRIQWQEFNRTDHTNITWAFGQIYDVDKAASALGVGSSVVRGRDITSDFPIPIDSVCSNVWMKPFTVDCQNAVGGCLDRTALDQVPITKHIAFEWDDMQTYPDLIEINGDVIKVPPGNEPFDSTMANEILHDQRGQDTTRAFLRLGRHGREITQCLKDFFKVGDLSKETVGCMAYAIIQIAALLAIGLLIAFRFLLAVTFSWFLSHQLDKMVKKKKKKKAASHSRSASIVSRALCPSRTLADVVWMTLHNALDVEELSEFAQESAEPVGDTCDDPFVLLLVTCYSEGEASLRLTLDSLALTDYHDHRKLIFVVADGQIVGAGNSSSTPEIVRKLMKFEPKMEVAEPQSYIAVADGTRRHNMAKVYAGQYHCRGRVVPCILVDKCGTLEESITTKPGNRGKRDSQLILMNFMQRVIFNDRMTPLDFDLFNKICWLMGVTPDVLEIVLMVDADTKVAVDSLGRMVNAMRRDQSVMGLCGETRIANKRSSWVSAIQVFEYYISHHLGKAFESVFGGVTCLPGCFCMYRIKANKSGRILPILASPIVIEEYSSAVVDTLHKKNLLLLGEDRFLTTLMLKLFPKRKIIFVPRAYCKTFVPDEFRVLLSQRRRWINSTIHNLLELVLVPDLCGIFCFSMQFVVLMELIGTVVLPAAIVFTFVLIGTAFINLWHALIPLILLGAVLGLPAVLILITTRKLVYIGWMIAYLLALPIWNFVLPIYAYWHFDDFSWGQTRKIEGEDADHDDESNRDAAGKAVIMKTWIGWSRYWEAIRAKEAAIARDLN